MAQNRTQGSSGFQTLLTGHLGVGVGGVEAPALLLTSSVLEPRPYILNSCMRTPSSPHQLPSFHGPSSIHETYKLAPETLSSQVIP